MTTEWLRRFAKLLAAAMLLALGACATIPAQTGSFGGAYGGVSGGLATH